jgi:hypothetical protein
MKITRRFVSFATQALNPRRWLSAAKRGAIRVEFVAVSLLLMPVILVMADHLPFVDVPSSAFYHDAVSAVFGARITTGTSPSTFSPEDPVLRGQMAAFLHRGLGRVAYTAGDSVPLSNLVNTDYIEIARLRINTGGAAGGTGFLKVDAAFTATNFGSGCRCRIRFYLAAEGGPNSQFHNLTLDDLSGISFSDASGAVTLAFPLPTGNRPQNVRLYAKIVDSDNIDTRFTSGQGSITAIRVPFGATGGSTLNAASAEPGEAPQGTEPDGKPDTEK